MNRSAERRDLRTTGRRRGTTVENADGQRFAGVAFDTELNWMAAAFCENVLRGIVFGHPTRERAERTLAKYMHVPTGAIAWADERDLEHQPRTVRELIEKLRLMAAGEPMVFHEIKIDVGHLTEFGQQIVAACRKIPWGRTSSYGELAAACGSPGAARAVGQVMAKNRYPLVVPCHRVLAAGGKLGGFSAPGRLSTKRRLLELESGEKS